MDELMDDVMWSERSRDSWLTYRTVWCRSSLVMLCCVIVYLNWLMYWGALAGSQNPQCFVLDKDEDGRCWHPSTTRTARQSWHGSLTSLWCNWTGTCIKMWSRDLQPHLPSKLLQVWGEADRRSISKVTSRYFIGRAWPRMATSLLVVVWQLGDIVHKPKQCAGMLADTRSLQKTSFVLLCIMVH